MAVQYEKEVGTTSKIFSRSYFALIPVFKKRKKSNTERNIIKIIHKSNICKSNPILRTLLIENVRICCIIVESSGKQSVKILCASAPYMVALISKASPNFENFLRNEKISSCIKVLKESDLESILNNVYHSTVFIHRGVKKFYPAVCVGIIRDSFLFSEKSLLYLLKLFLHVLQSSIEFLYNNTKPLFHYLCHQNYSFVTYLADLLPHLFVDLIKYSIVATQNIQKTALICISYMRKIVLYLIRILNRLYRNSDLSNWLKKTYVFFNSYLSYLRSTDAYNTVEQTFLRLLHVSKPYIRKYFLELVEIVKKIMLTSVPLMKDTVRNIIKESIPLIRKFIDDNLESILSWYNIISSFLRLNIHRIKPFCCHTCRFLYSSIFYLYNIVQAVVPHIIELSSTSIIAFITCSTYILEYCMYLCKNLCNYLVPVLDSQRRLLCSLSQTAVNILKTFYETLLNAQPYLALIFRMIFSELTQLIHILSPTLQACFHEMNSSVFCASKEVVAKSCLAVKRITPSFYYTVKTVVPPTVLATHEIIKSSKNSVIVICPAVVRSILTIRPEVEKGIVILFTDGNKACFEVISVSYSASCQLKDAAKTVSSNIPIFCMAVREILITTTYAAAEVSTTSLNAKCRMLKDFWKAYKAVHISFMLAEQEISTAYMDFVHELNSIMVNSQEGILCEKTIVKSVGDYFSNFCNNYSCSRINSIFHNIFTLLISSMKYFLIYLGDVSDLFVYVLTYMLLGACTLSINALKHEIPKMKALRDNLFNKLWHIFRTVNYAVTPRALHLRGYLCSKFSGINVKIIKHVCENISRIWYSFKYNLCLAWNKFCELSPEIWAAIEHVTSVIWNFIIENIPGAWNTWKTFCSAIWILINDIAPHMWYYSSTITPVLWYSGREVTIQFWNLFVTTSTLLWQYTNTLSSEYWLLSKTYLPQMWFTSCAETKKGWNITCFLIENCWNFTVETCSLSWNLLHRTVAKSWKNSILFTKTAYFMFTTTGSMLQKSFCVCCKSKNYAYVILEVTPQLSDFTLNSFHLPKLQRICLLSSKRETSKSIQNHPGMLVSGGSSSEQQGYASRLYIRSSISAAVSSLSWAYKLFKYEKFIPSKLLARNRPKLTST